MAHAAPLEIEIRNLLMAKRTARETLAVLLPRLYDNQTSYADRHLIFSFAWNSGIHLPAFEQIPELLRREQIVPWAWLSEFFARTPLAPINEVTEAILKGAQLQGHTSELTTSRVWDKFIPTLVELRREVQRLREEKQRAQKQNLLNKLAFYRNENLADEEKKLLQWLDKLYPEDSQIKQLSVDFSERWARHIISRHASSDATLFEQHDSPVTADDSAHIQPLFEEWKRLAEKRPEMVYEFAVALLMMEMDLFALDLLGAGELDYACDWLKAELLLRSGRHVECLNHLVSLEARYGSDPETAFAVTYIRAQALRGLRQYSKAVELIKTLLSIRPNYRSAASLLKGWDTA